MTFLKKNLIHLNDRQKLLDANHPHLSLRKQCELLGVNRSSYYYEPKPYDERRLQLLRLVDGVYTAHPYFGSRQMTNYLCLNGHNVGRGKIRGVYKELGLEAVCPGPHTSKPRKEHEVYPYLLSDVAIVRRDQVWSTDITFLPMKKGFVYLMAIIDWFTRYVIDWEISITLEADFCIEALARALKSGKCDIFNTDQGAQFTCKDFTKLLLDPAFPR